MTHPLLHQLRRQLDAVLDLISPRCCAVCGRVLSEHERLLCLKCYMDLPRTGYHKAPHSFLETDYWARIPVGRAAAFFFYNEQNRQLLFSAKYHAKPGAGEYLGRLMAQEISNESDFFNDIDLIVPIPLHRRREKWRGYNQSDYIALGIHHVTGIPICRQAVVRTVDTESQTALTHAEREQNVKDIFRCTRPDLLRGRHILLVDDVVTTGATTRSCAQAILQALGEYDPNGINITASVRFSILALAIASKDTMPMTADTPYRKDLY